MTDENDGALMSAAPPKVAALLTFTNVHTTTNTNTTNKFSKSGEEEDLVDDEIERVLNTRGVKRSSFFEIEKNGAENIEDVTFGAMMKTHVHAMISHALLVSEDATIVISGDDFEMTLKQFACAISWASESLFEKELRRLPKSAFTLKATCAAIGMKEKATLVDVVAMRTVGGLGASSSEDERKGAKLERTELVNKEDARDIVKYLPRGDDRAVGFCFYLKVGENRPVGKLSLIHISEPTRPY